MHKKLVIENFKCFSKKTVMKLGKINICLGSNSVGKSSVIQSCILLRQIYEQAVFFQKEYTRERLLLNILESICNTTKGIALPMLR